MTEATARFSPMHLNRGESTGRRRRPRDSPEPLHKWKAPFQPTLRKQGPQAETWGAEKRKKDSFSNLCFLKSESRHHQQNGEWPKKRRRGTTGLTVPMTRHGQEPEPSHNLQENSHARFLQLDKTTVRRNQPEQSRSRLRQALRR